MKYFMTDAEQMIMEIFWKHAQWMTTAELSQELEMQGIEWKRQTINTFLTRLMKKDLVIQNKRKYIYACTRAEYETMRAKEFLKEEYGGSFRKFAAALSGHQELADGDIQCLLEELKQYR